MNEQLKTGFIKAALEEGYTKEQAVAIFNKQASKPLLAEDVSKEEITKWFPKQANEQHDNFAQVREMLSNKGVKPNYGIDDTDPYAAEYNRKLLELRDRSANQDPDMESAKAAVKGGAKGGLYGFGSGHIGGEIAKHFVNPKYSKTISHLPGAARYVGLGLGALAGAVPAATKVHSEVEAAKSLNNPGEIQTLMNQLSRERQLSNNQIGTYRNLQPY